MTTFADRPGYERTSSSLWKQREEYCASLIQQAWRDHHTEALSQPTAHQQGKKREARNGKKIEVQPSPSPEN